MHEGDPADSLHLVESGRLAVRVTTPSGERATLNLLGPGQYFGELSLLDGRAPIRSASIVALEPSTTRTLSATAFRELRQRHRAAERFLLALLARRVEELSGRVRRGDVRRPGPPGAPPAGRARRALRRAGSPRW